MTPESREEARERGYCLRDLKPSEKAQERYPLDKFPCDRCETQALPNLTDNGCEFNWEHQHADLGFSNRSECKRFGGSFIGTNPKPGTATSLFLSKLTADARRYYPARTEEEYLKAQYEVEENGADDANKRVK